MARGDKCIKNIDWVREHGNELTAKEIANTLGIAVCTAYHYAEIAGIELQRSPGGRPPKTKGAKTKEVCKLRPFGCFNCPNPDCVCDLGQSRTERKYIEIGCKDHSEETERKRAYQRAYARKKRKEKKDV